MNTPRSSVWIQGFVASCAILLALGIPGLARAQTALYSQATPGSWSYVVPANIYFVTVTLAGGGGGGGGWDAQGRGGNGGSGASVTAIIGVAPGQTLSGVVATGGAGGASPQSANACKGGGAGGTGGATGGTGGNQSCGSGYSGGGGGGGGSTTLMIASNIVLQAGGGGGGGGGGLNNPATTTGAGANATALSGLATCLAVAGTVGANAPGDGGGGGGGGGGSTGGNGGAFGADNTTTPSTAGGGGGSCYLTSGIYIDAAVISGGPAGGAGATGYATGGGGTAGSVAITSLPSLLLQKTWGANSLPTDNVSVSTAGGAKVASLSSNGIAAGGTVAGTRVYEKSGNAITLPVESFAPSASALKYVSTLTCTNATAPPTSVAPPRTITLTPADTAVICTYANAPMADLSIKKTTNTSPVVSGQPVSYTIVVSNAGPATVTGAVVKDSPGSGLSCPNSGIVTCSGTGCPAGSITNNALMSGAGLAMSTLPAGASATLTVTCNVN